MAIWRRRPADVEAGHVYRSSPGGRVQETARVMAITADKAGIPHVRYHLSFGRPDQRFRLLLPTEEQRRVLRPEVEQAAIGAVLDRPSLRFLFRRRRMRVVDDGQALDPDLARPDDAVHLAAGNIDRRRILSHDRLPLLLARRRAEIHLPDLDLVRPAEEVGALRRVLERQRSLGLAQGADLDARVGLFGLPCRLLPLLLRLAPRGAASAC